MMLDKFLKWTTYTALFAVLFTPFIVAESLFFPFIVGKNLFFRVFIEIAFVSWAVLALRDVTIRPKKSSLLAAFAAFVVILGVANAFGENPWKSFWSNFERMEGYITLLHLFAYFLVASCMLKTERLWQRFFESSLWASSAVALYGIFQLFGWVGVAQSGARIDSTLGNATYLAVYSLFHIFLALIIIAKDSAPWKEFAYGSIALINLVALYNTGTRGAVLGLLAGLAVYAVITVLFDKENRKRRIFAGSVLGAVIIMIGGFMLVRDASFVRESHVLSRFASISVEDLKTQGRYFIWPMAIDGFKNRPLLGWGQENFNYVFNANYDPRMYGQEQWFDRAHNVLLDWLIAGGLLGLIAYLALFGAAIYLLWFKAGDTSIAEKSLLSGLLAAYFVNNLFVFDNITSYMMFVSVLAFVQFKSTRLSMTVFDGAGVARRSTTQAVGAVAVVVLVFGMYFINWRAYATASSLLDALREASVTPANATLALAAFEKAASYDTVGRGEVVERIVEAVPRINTQETPTSVRQSFNDLGNRAVSKQLLRAPGDARYELFAGMFYSQLDDAGRARAHLLEASKLSPNKQSILYALGSFYLNYGQPRDAADTFRQAYEAETSNKTAALYYAAALVAMGQEVEARAFLMESTGTEDMTSDIFLQAYANSGNWQRVVSILRQRIVADPTNLSLRQNLAAAYLESGDSASAIAVIREMIKLDPSFAQLGEEFIRQIQAGTAN